MVRRKCMQLSSHHRYFGLGTASRPKRELQQESDYKDWSTLSFQVGATLGSPSRLEAIGIINLKFHLCSSVGLGKALIARILGWFDQPRKPLQLVPLPESRTTRLATSLQSACSLWKMTRSLFVWGVHACVAEHERGTQCHWRTRCCKQDSVRRMDGSCKPCRMERAWQLMALVASYLEYAHCYFLAKLTVTFSVSVRCTVE